VIYLFQWLFPLCSMLFVETIFYNQKIVTVDTIVRAGNVRCLVSTMPAIKLSMLLVHRRPVMESKNH